MFFTFHRAFKWCAGFVNESCIDFDGKNGQIYRGRGEFGKGKFSLFFFFQTLVNLFFLYIALVY